MIYLKLPTGDNGPGVRGDNLVKALESVIDVERLGNTSRTRPVPGALVQMVGPRFCPRPGLTAPYHIGYAVFEHDVTARKVARDAHGFDVIATASRWCEQVLRDAGKTAVTTIHGGVDGTRFNSTRAVRRRFRDRFVVFSGGKFELRKAQDVVARAFKAFAAHHADALLVAAWDNPEFRSVKSMKASPHFRLRFDTRDKCIDDLLGRWVHSTELREDQLQRVPRMPNAEMVDVYANSDIGLFPNRCEGDTNLIMMEYMACGRPVIATDFAGHRDLLTNTNSMRLRNWRPTPFHRNGSLVACWGEPDVDEIVGYLEKAYRDRDLLANIGRQAAADLSQWTWTRAARQFLDLLGESSLPQHRVQASLGADYIA